MALKGSKLRTKNYVWGKKGSFSILVGGCVASLIISSGV